MENTNLFLDLTESEMLALCKRVMNLEPAARDCVVERYDGIDLDALILTHARTWYDRLLMEAPAALLPTDDLKDLVSLTDCGQGVVQAHLPECCVRPLEVQLQHWEHSVTSFVSAGDCEAQLQLNPWTRGGLHHPVAVDHGNHLMLYSLPVGLTPVLVMARCVVYRQDRFCFHHSAVSMLATYLAQAVTLTPEL